MTRVAQVKLALFAIGVVVWGYGTAADDATLRWIGIAFLAAGVLLRFLPRRLSDEDRPPT